MTWGGTDVVIWDTTGPRHLGAAGQHEILVVRSGLTLPRVVLNPADPHGSALLATPASDLSEIAAAEGHYRKRYFENPSNSDFTCAENLAALRAYQELRIVDLDDDEMDDYIVLTSDEFAEDRGLLAPLGRGESAVLAIAANREWRAGLDDKAARTVAADLGLDVVTTRQWLLEQVDARRRSTAEVTQIYATIRAGGFWGPPDLTDP